MDLEALKFAVKYPFTSSAKQVLTSLKVDFANLSEENIDFAYLTLLDLMKKKFLSQKDIENSKENYLQKLLVSYPICNIIVNLSKSVALKTKYARMRAQQTKFFIEFEKSDVIKKLKDELLKVQGDKISFIDYLNSIPNSLDYKLFYQDIENGFVSLNSETLKELLSEKAYDSAINTKFVDMKYPKSMIFYANDIIERQFKQEFSEDYGKVNMEAFPPCMRSITKQLLAGEQVSHIPKFVLVTFLIGIGMPDEEIVKIYSNQQNFAREKTLYHIQHAKGTGTSTTKYSAPGCTKMATYGTCQKDETCKWAHPLRYYKVTKDRIERVKKK